MAIDYKKLMAQLEEKLKSPETEEYFAKLKRQTDRQKRWQEKIKSRLIENPELLENFLKWEEVYEEKYYARSKLFSLIKGIWSKNGKDVSDDQDFLCGSYLYLGYKIETFCGQGCFYRVWKGEEIIFQST